MPAQQGRRRLGIGRWTQRILAYIDLNKMGVQLKLLLARADDLSPLSPAFAGQKSKDLKVRRARASRA